jgi:hypothetical protein
LRLGALALVAVAVAVAAWSLPARGGAPQAPRLAATAATGALSVGNSLDGRAILSGGPLVPGASLSGTVTVSNAGRAPGAFSLTSSSLVDTPGPRGGRLSEVLDLAVERVDEPTPALVYTGRLAALGTRALGTLRGAESRTYRLTVSFPASAGDAYGSSSLSVGFDWGATPGPARQEVAGARADSAGAGPGGGSSGGAAGGSAASAGGDAGPAASAGNGDGSVVTDGGAAGARATRGAVGADGAAATGVGAGRAAPTPTPRATAGADHARGLRLSSLGAALGIGGLALFGATLALAGGGLLLRRRVA